MLVEISEESQNLRWDTPQANVDDTLRHGRRAVGSRCNSKLVEEDVIEIRRLRAEGFPARELAGRYGVSPRNIRAIVSGKLWRHVPLAAGVHDGAGVPPPYMTGEDRAAC